MGPPALRRRRRRTGGRARAGAGREPARYRPPLLRLPCAQPRLRRILRPLLAQRSRDSLVVSSKGGTLTGQAGASGAQRRDFSVAAIRASCQASLRNLGLDYLDICQPHGASEHDINDDLLLAMQRLRERGLIRHTGINTHSASTLHWMIANPDVFDGVLLDYNALQSAMASAPPVTDLHLSRPRLRQSGRHEKSHRRPHRFPADRHCVVVRRALHDHAWPVQGHRATRHRCTGTLCRLPACAQQPARPAQRLSGAASRSRPRRQSVGHVAVWPGEPTRWCSSGYAGDADRHRCTVAGACAVEARPQ
ncbi:oxidoreductase [Xanthomonas axonopodis Xac29-1]|nr:oxidoreductase [Xanthomonas axonopodis Xac29-1]